MRETRKIIKIDEELCNGCGQCVPSCAEGAIEIVNGKARVKAERYCDGLGACLGECPQGALTIIEREADAFDEAAVHEMLAREKAVEANGPGVARRPAGGGCPGARAMSFERRPEPAGSVARRPVTPCACSGGAEAAQESELGHWPVKIRLVPADAPFLKGADLLIAADCAPVACAGFHSDFLRGKAVMIGCPKFDGAEEYGRKLTEVFQRAGLRSVTVLRMEVPCCAGLSAIVARAIELAGVDVPVEEVIVTRRGEIVRSQDSPLNRIGGLERRIHP